MCLDCRGALSKAKRDVFDNLLQECRVLEEKTRQPNLTQIKQREDIKIYTKQATKHRQSIAFCINSAKNCNNNIKSKQFLKFLNK
jgi:hypothetical protein